MTRVVVLLCAGLFVVSMALATGTASRTTPESLRRMASDYYRWRDQAYPVASSSQGLHTWDDRLTDFTPQAVAARKKHVAALAARVREMPTERWAKDDRIDWLLFRSQVETVEFFDRVVDSTAVDPQVYVDECSNAVFSLLKKDYAPASARARAGA